MIAFIRGKIQRADENLIVIESNGVGFELVTTTSTVSRLHALKDEVLINTYMHVREDAITLYGFYDLQEKNMFLKLITVSGIGPKLSINILSGTTPTDLALGILNADLSALSSIKGLGKKTAEKIVVELREKVGRIEDLELKGSKLSVVELNQNIEDAAFALTALGINKTEAIKLVSKIAKPDMTAEDLIKITLRDMGK